VANIDIQALVNYHKSHGKLATVTAVRPPSRFGEMIIQDQLVGTFKEKPQTSDGWINGGYFVLHRQVLDLIAGDETIFEAEPLHLLAEKKNWPFISITRVKRCFLNAISMKKLYD